MKKKNINGFMLTETLIVAVFVCSVLILLFTLLQRVESNFKKTFSYNTASSLYLTKEFKDYISNNYLELLIKDYVESPDAYFDLTNCDLKYFSSEDYCINLKEKLGISRVIFLSSDFYREKYTDIYSSRLGQDLIDFIDYVNEDEGGKRYRIVVSFKDGTYATLKLRGDNLYD